MDIQKLRAINCKNCGAPLVRFENLAFRGKSLVCDYCGTKHYVDVDDENCSNRDFTVVHTMDGHHRQISTYAARLAVNRELLLYDEDAALEFIQKELVRRLVEGIKDNIAFSTREDFDSFINNERIFTAEIQVVNDGGNFDGVLFIPKRTL